MTARATAKRTVFRIRADIVADSSWRRPRRAASFAAAQRAFAHRARMNGLATLGKWAQGLEKEAA